MKTVLFLACLTILATRSRATMTEAQVQASIKLVRNVCQPKFKITMDQINEMHQGVFADDRKQMCYMQCCLQFFKAMKDEKFLPEAVLAQADTLPIERKQSTIDTVNECRDAAKSTEKCEAAYQITQCFYKSNPEKYFLP